MKLNTRYEFPTIINQYKLEVGAEIGTDAGYFSYYLLKHSKIKLLYSVDQWKGSYQNHKLEAEKSLAYFGPRSKILHMSSEQAANWMKQNNILLDWVYIDANHRYKYVKQDIELWYPLIRSGGVLAGHDWIPDDPGTGVVPAVNQFIQNHKYLQLFLTDDHLRSWWVRKPEIVK